MNSPRVLIVDDNEMFIEAATFILRAAAYIVESACDASHALLQTPAFRPDLILMDIDMPVMNGLELTRRLKADPTTQHIVVVAFTSYAIKGDEGKLRDAGCDGYISKPVDVMTLAAEVRFWLEGTANEQGNRFAWP
jgi:CheY-like chemotaxis protein